MPMTCQQFRRSPNQFYQRQHQITIEIESEGSIAFLDTKTTGQDNGSIIVSVYRKATHTDHYLDFKSHHDPQHKHSVVHTLMDHAKNIPSTEEEALRETNRVTEALTGNNYPANFIYNGRQLNRQQVNDIGQRGIVILPYAKGFSERIAKVLRGFNIKVVHKPIRTISNILKKPKDKIEKETSSIYSLGSVLHATRGLPLYGTVHHSNSITLTLTV